MSGPWYVLRSYQGAEWEEVDQADTKAEARELLGEYRLAFGAGWGFLLTRNADRIGHSPRGAY